MTAFYNATLLPRHRYIADLALTFVLVAFKDLVASLSLAQYTAGILL